MHCTSGTECLSRTLGSHSVCAVRTPLEVDWKILSIRKEPMLSSLLTLKFRASCFMLEINEFSGHCGSVAEQWWLTPELFWVQLPTTAGFFTFLYFHLTPHLNYRLLMALFMIHCSVSNAWMNSCWNNCILFLLLVNSFLRMYQFQKFLKLLVI